MLHLQIAIYSGLYKTLLMEKNFNSLEDWNRYLPKDTWSNSLPKNDKKFWEDGIMKLPEKWQKVVAQNNKEVVQ